MRKLVQDGLLETPVRAWLRENLYVEILLGENLYFETNRLPIEPFSKRFAPHTSLVKTKTTRGTERATSINDLKSRLGHDKSKAAQIVEPLPRAKKSGGITGSFG